MKQPDVIRIQHMLAAANDALQFSKGRSRKDLENDRILALAIIKCIEVNPIKIILFGSASRGDDSQGSDYDILVIIPEGTHRRNTSKILYKEIAESGVPVDIIVATPNDIEKHKNNIGLIYRSILVEGKELYAA